MITLNPTTNHDFYGTPVCMECGAKYLSVQGCWVHSCEGPPPQSNTVLIERQNGLCLEHGGYFGDDEVCPKCKP